MKLLCLSNGHGEDAIAVEVLKQLRQEIDFTELAALPIVGEGHAYRKLEIPILGAVKTMPSGGFIYMDRKQFWRDLQGGLLPLTLAQYRVVRGWGQKEGAILAVGDIVPLLFAWISRANYAFIGTAKSEYYLRNEAGWLPQTSRLERLRGSDYYPWERSLLGCRRCRGVFPRDQLTTNILQKWSERPRLFTTGLPLTSSIPAVYLGNVMMDSVAAKPEPSQKITDSLTIVLLPGSRMPEALQNWQQILAATQGVIDNFAERSLLFLGAIAPALSLESFESELIKQSWQSCKEIWSEDRSAAVFTQKNATLVLTQNTYSTCLHRADCAIAMAGTATEQCVGLGKAVFSFPGGGPQFTSAFAEAQTRLLGASVILVAHPSEVAPAMRSLLNDPGRVQQLAENGRQRMGRPGAAKRIADYLTQKLLTPEK